MVITAGDRTEILLGTLAANMSENYPSLSAIILTGGLTPDPRIWRLIEGFPLRIPIVSTQLDTFATATALATALRAAGAARVEVWCLARTPAPGGA
mgnify:CR=1 FL=1